MLTALFVFAYAQSAIDRVLDDALLKGALPGTCATTLEGKVVAARFEDTRLVPASNQKILTALFASKTLGMDFRPRTRFWREKDRLIVDCPGDPTITRQDLIDVRKKLGVPDDSAIYVRQAYAPHIPPSWEYDDLPNRYAAPITALSFDRGGFEVWAERGKLRQLDPAYKITLRHLPDEGTARVEYDPQKRLAIVRGQLPVSARMIEAFAVPDPDVVAARFLGGTIVHTSTVPEREPDHTIVGPTLREILKDCLERSDNNLAEHLLLMSATREKGLGTAEYAEAAKRMQTFLEDVVGLQPGSVRPIDGSGMSRQNLVTPRAVCQALAWAYKQDWRDDFLMALAEPGEGTLASRLSSSTFVGKTGTLSAVICLSGYVKTKSGQTLAVSLLFNNTLAPASEVRGLQDRVVTILERG